MEGRQKRSIIIIRSSEECAAIAGRWWILNKTGTFTKKYYYNYLFFYMSIPFFFLITIVIFRQHYFDHALKEQMNLPLWSDVTSTRSSMFSMNFSILVMYFIIPPENTDCYSLQEDFPELGSAANTSTTITQNPPTEVVSSAAPSLRPQSWCTK